MSMGSPIDVRVTPLGTSILLPSSRPMGMGMGPVSEDIGIGPALDAAAGSSKYLPSEDGSDGGASWVISLSGLTLLAGERSLVSGGVKCSVP